MKNGVRVRMAVAGLFVSLGALAAVDNQTNASPVLEKPPFYTNKFDLLCYLDKEGQRHEVRNAGEWELRREHILAGMQQVMGPLPGKAKKVKPDMLVVSTQRLERVTRMKITYAAEPGDRVPAYLLVPDGLKGKTPAILCLHQTIGVGKDEPAGVQGSPNLKYALELAERGYVTLAPDYPGYGEYQNNPYAKLGYESATMKGIWQHMAGLDLLASLPEVDAERMGCIGHSLGGHNTLFVAAFDPRIKVAVSSCGFDSFEDCGGGNFAIWSHWAYMPRIQSVYGCDPKRTPFDWPEVLAVIAPRAVFVNAPTGDGGFRVASVKRCLAAAGKVYEMLGAPDNLKAAHPASGHGFPKETREEAYTFIDTILGKQ